MTVHEPQSVEPRTAAPPPTRTSRAGDKLLDVEPEAFRAHYLKHPFLIRHHVANHPLFSLPRLIELSKTLPPAYVEYNAGNIPVSIDSRLTPQNGLSIEETIRRIEDHCSWMVLKRVEQDPEYN